MKGDTRLKINSLWGFCIALDTEVPAQMIKMKNYARYSERLPHGDKTSAFRIINFPKKSVFIPFQAKNDNVSMKIFYLSLISNAILSQVFVF